MTAGVPTDLADRLMRRIQEDGPIGVDTFMAACLADPQGGYYQQADPFGTAGDFITAPEISGLFGEMCGLYLAHIYDLAGSPEDAAIIELGPGRGTLMRDMRHVWSQLMPAMTSLPLHFLETGHALRRLQASTVQTDRIRTAASWHDDITDLLAATDGPVFGIANEFFDALPVAQLIRHDGQWHQRQVGILDGRLGFTIGPSVPEDVALNGMEKGCGPSADGAVLEHCPQADLVIAALARQVAQHGGAMLIIDYGRDGNPGDSLQAVADHKPVDIFHAPGQSDLSHWVDFAALEKAASAAGARLVPPVPQGQFLMRIGLAARAEQAGKMAAPETRRALLAAIDRLTSPEQMGAVFKVALLVPRGDGTPPGFEQDSP